MSESPSFEASRRSVIRGGAIGAGALLGALGLGTGTAAAAPAALTAEADSTVASVSAGPAVTAAAAVTTNDRVFLKLDGIAGESTLKGLESWIELSDFSWGAQDALPAPTAGGTGTGKVTALAVSFSAPTSKATPLLLGSTVTGKHIKTGKLVVTRTVASGLIQFIKIDLTDVVIDYLKIDTPSAGIPTDRGNLVFSKIKFAYYPQDPKGGLSTPVSVEWDTRTNKV